MTNSRHLPLSSVTLVFGVLRIPLAFVRHLCVPATIMALLAVLFSMWGRWMVEKGRTFDDRGLRRSALGLKLALVGGVCGVLMWVLWATGALL